MKNFAVVRSADAPRHVSLEELHAHAERVIARASRTGRPMPPILVMHVSESVAAVVGVGSTGVIRHNRNPVAELSSYYEVWLVGQAGIGDYVMALQGIVDDFHKQCILSEFALHV
jgi:hypothetical protein